MKHFMRKTPFAFIVLLISLSSGLIGYLFVPVIHNAPGSSYLHTAMLVVIPSLLISAIVSAPVVYFYRKIIIENYHLIEALKKDALTGLLNRHSFFDIYTSKVESYKQEINSMALIMMDIDDFKLINDSYGHFAGDKVITSFAKILTKNVKKSDLICRFGGEEFLVVLWDISREEAVTVSKRLLKELDAIIEFETKHISFTTSVGMAHFNQCHMKPDEYLIIADEALYQAKKDGKNRLEYNCYKMDKKYKSETII